MGRLDINILQDGLGRQSASFDSFAGIFFELPVANYAENYTSGVHTSTSVITAEAFLTRLINDATTEIPEATIAIFRQNIALFFGSSINGTLLLQAGTGTSSVPSYVFNAFRLSNENVRLYGFLGDTVVTFTQTNITLIHNALDAMFESYTLSARCVFKSSTGDIDNGSPLTGSQRVQALGFDLTDDDDDTGVVGLTLGQLTNYPVHQKQSWRSHPLNIDLSIFDEGLNIQWVGGETPEQRTPTVIDSYNTNGIVIAGVQNRLTGTYFLNSRMAVDTTSDFAIMTHCRVMDKAIALVAAALTPQLDGPAYVATDTGQLSADTIGFFKTLAYDAINTNMVLGKSGNNVELSTDSTTGELPRDIVIIDPDQNILSAEDFIIGLSLPPVGSTGRITLNIGLSNPALNN